MKTRPDSALMNEMTPIGLPDAAVIGTLIAERMPMVRSSSRCSGSWTAVSSSSSVISGMSCEWPSRSTCAAPPSSLVRLG